MKRILFYLALFLSSHLVAATDTLSVKSKISEVTVFYNGAQVTRTAKMNFSKQKYLLKMDDLPGDINPQSIQVSSMKNCKILAVKQELYTKESSHVGKDKSASEQAVRLQEMKIKGIKNKILVFDKEEKLLMDNSILNKSDNGSNIADIKEAANFYRVRLNEILDEKLKLTNQLDSTNDELKKLYLAANEQSARMRSSGCRIMITVECEKESAAELTVSYYVASAAWKPNYDFRVENISQPLVIVYNANVYQSTGEDWQNVNLKLSTFNPALKGSKPDLKTFYLGRPVENKMESQGTGATGALKGKVLDSDTKEPLPYVTIAVLKNGSAVSGTYTDLDGQYTIKPLVSDYYTIRITYIGYHSVEIGNVRIEADKTTYHDFTMSAAAMQLDEVVVSSLDKNKNRSREGNSNAVQSSSMSTITFEEINARGSRGDASTYYADGTKMRKLESTDYIGNSLHEAVTNIEYTIDLPYTVLSDGEDNQIKIKESSVPVHYVHYSVPKLDHDVFLVAQVTDWAQLNLLSGATNIYYQGTFTSQSYLNARNPEDTLNISLGRDQGIVISREGNKLIQDKKVSSNTITETIGWEIVVRNNKNQKVDITIEDQVPVSENKAIEVELLQSSSAKVDEKSGKVNWSISLEPGEKKTFSLQYRVKYPRTMALGIE